MIMQSMELLFIKTAEEVMPPKHVYWLTF